jgi:nitroreductase
MENLAELIKAIPIRRSVRTFESTDLSQEILDKLKIFSESLNVPFVHNTKPLFFKAESGKKLYNNGVNSPNNVALFSQTDKVSISKTGFIGELIVLYATSLGISSCWFGHYNLRELGRYIDGIYTRDRIKESTWGMGYGYGNRSQIDVGERVICCLALGEPDENSKRIINMIMDKIGTKRKSIDELIDAKAELQTDIKDVLELARLAPSAGNSQMWRFGVVNGAITVAKSIGYKHFKWEHPDVDIGICASHIWLGLLNKGYEPKISIEMSEDRVMWKFEYL